MMNCNSRENASSFLRWISVCARGVYTAGCSASNQRRRLGQYFQYIALFAFPAGNATSLWWKKKSYLGKQWVFSEYFFSGFLSFCILSYCLATLYRASAYRHSAALIRVRWRYCICVIDEYSLEVCCAERRLTGVRAPTIFDASKRLCRECLSTCLVFFFSRFVFWKLSLLIQCIPTSCAYIHAVVPCVGLRLRKTAENIFVNSAWYSKVQPANTTIANTCWDQRDSCLNRKTETRNWVHNDVLVTVYKEKL